MMNTLTSKSYKVGEIKRILIPCPKHEWYSIWEKKTVWSFLQHPGHFFHLANVLVCDLSWFSYSPISIPILKMASWTLSLVCCYFCTFGFSYCRIGGLWRWHGGFCPLTPFLYLSHFMHSLKEICPTLFSFHFFPTPTYVLFYVSPFDQLSSPGTLISTTM